MNISQKKYTNKIIKDNILPNSIYFLIVGEKQMLKVWCIGKCEVEDHKDMNICVDVGHTTFYYLLSQYNSNWYICKIYKAAQKDR